MPRLTTSTDAAPAPVGPYSQGARVGDVLAVAGQVGITAAGVTAEGIAAQTRQAFENIGAILTAAGAGFEDVVQVRVFLVDKGDFAAMNDVYAEFFDSRPPARSTVYVGLPRDLLVEIDVLAVLDGER
ncbi:MAG TPA: Rid family detoxifying hydrolase [Solirubrobacterales bacterium]